MRARRNKKLKKPRRKQQRKRTSYNRGDVVLCIPTLVTFIYHIDICIAFVLSGSGS